jgi:hypothetical protein
MKLKSAFIRCCFNSLPHPFRPVRIGAISRTEIFLRVCMSQSNGSLKVTRITERRVRGELGSELKQQRMGVFLEASLEMKVGLILAAELT